MRYFAVIFLMLMCGVAYAAGHGEGHVIDISKTDIFQRSVNFIIFVGLMWYLLADKLKAMLHARSREIADKLSNAQAKVQESRHKKEKAQQRLKDTSKQVAELTRIAKQEAALSAQRIDEKAKEQVAALIKANEEAMEFQEKLFQKQIIEEILNEAFKSPKLEIDSKDYIGILEKKVA